MKTQFTLLVVLFALSRSVLALPLSSIGEWEIRIPSEAHPAVQYAAEELRDFLGGTSGNRLAVVVSEKLPEGQIWILPRHSPTEDSPAVRTDDLEDEDLRIIVSEDRIGLAGGSPRGTLYAVYTFAEDELGVRFLTPDHTHLPKLSENHPLTEGSRTFRPIFRWRYAYYGANHRHPAFAVRLRNNAITDDARLGGRSNWSLINHSVSRYVPVRQFGAEHPEYFSFVDGRRRGFVSEDHFGDGGTQPCLTNPEVKRLIREGVLAELKRNPSRGNISVSQSDNQMYCRCDECRAIDEREGSAMGSLLTLVNETAGTVADQFPGVYVGTLAYQYSRKPPEHLRPRANVAIQLCSIEACLIHPINDPDCPRNVPFCADLAGWSEITDQIYIWNYNVNFHQYHAPCPNLRVIAPNLRHFAANDVRGVFMQAAGNAQSTELCDLRNYLISRLLWDPKRNDRELIAEFLRLHYGHAAPAMQQYLDLIHDNAEQRAIHQHCFGTALDYGVDSELAEKCLDLFAEALAASETDQIRRRVEKASITAYAAAIDPFSRWLRRHYGQIREGQPLQAPEDLVQDLAPHLRRFFELCERHGVDRYSEWIPLASVKAVLPPSLLE